MPPKTKKMVLADTLEDLSKKDFKKFCHQLLDRREEPRVKRNKVEDKSRLQVVDVLVSTFTESGAVEVAKEILGQIGCSEEAEALDKEAGGQSSKPGSSDTAGPSAGAAGVKTMADDKHFVDKYQVQLIQRVNNIGPILDELLHEEVIQQESYAKIRALPTSQEKMRELYNYLNVGVCKNIFYNLLKKYEKHLIEDLN